MKFIKSLLSISIIIISHTMNSQSSIYDISITGIDGKEIKISDFKNKNILFVNVASKCGFTGQYNHAFYNKSKSIAKILVKVCCINSFGKVARMPKALYDKIMSKG